jgi:hypothetical protein
MPKGMRPITTYDVFEGEKTVVKNTTETSVPIDLREIAQDGFFSAEYTITGSGTITLAYTVCSTKNGTYFTPTGGGSIASGLTVGHGGLAFEPEMYPFIKITATETVNSANAGVTIKLNIQ